MTFWKAHESRIPKALWRLSCKPKDIRMVCTKALRVAERMPIDGATLIKLKQASKDLRTLTPDSALADLVDAKIKSIESPQRGSRS